MSIDYIGFRLCVAERWLRFVDSLIIRLLYIQFKAYYFATNRMKKNIDLVISLSIFLCSPPLLLDPMIAAFELGFDSLANIGNLFP